MSPSRYPQCASLLLVLLSATAPVSQVDAFASLRYNAVSCRHALCYDRLATSELRLAAAAADDDDDDEGKSSNSASNSSTDKDKEDEDPEDEVSQAVAKARQLIEKTKQKIVELSADDSETEGAEEEEEQDEALPFFATQAVDEDEVQKRRDLITKSKDEESGLITADGEKMASLAEEEKWESRGLYDLFRNEIEEDEESLAAEKRASRDVAAAMMNLRMRMNKDDFDAIFDKNNRFIGEE